MKGFDEITGYKYSGNMEWLALLNPMLYIFTIGSFFLGFFVGNIVKFIFLAGVGIF